ncbi:vacuolar protein sorting-associated protein 62 [Tanacetum coccineum]
MTDRMVMWSAAAAVKMGVKGSGGNGRGCGHASICDGATRLELEIEQGVLGDLELQGEWTQEEARSIEGSLNVEEPHYDLSRPSFELAPDQEKKELGDTLKQFRELFPDDDKFGDFHKRFAEMFKFGRGFGEDGKDGNEEVNAGETRAGKVEDAEGSGGQGDVEGSGRKSRKAREHVSDWEHMRLGIDNVSGKLESIYLSQDTKWLQANEFEYINGRPVAYA